MNFNLNQIKEINEFYLKIKKWNGLNLISKKNQEEIYNLHVNEALSIYEFLKQETLPIIDFGAGNGIIAFVLNILNIKVECVEINESKINFIKNIAKLKCSNKIEYTNYIAIVKGVAKLNELFKLLKNVNKIILFKSENYQNEINDVLKFYNFEYKIHKRVIQGVILEIFNIKKKILFK